MKTLLATTLALGVLALAGCSHGPLDGTYGTQAKNGIQLVFSGDDVTLTKDGQNINATYKLKGDRLTILNAQGQPWTVHVSKQGCLYDYNVAIKGTACKE